MIEIFFIILGIIGFLQIVGILIGVGLGLGRVSVINKWKTPDLFWVGKIEMFIVKLFSKNK